MDRNEGHFPLWFTEKVIEDWGDRTDISKLENYLLSKYLTNSSLAVIEAGTGAGVLSFFIEESLKFDKITAFDIIPEMIDRALIKSKEKKSNIHFTYGDASNLKNFKPNEFHYMVYLQQILSMIPCDRLDHALNRAHNIGTADGIFIFSFLDWDSRWYNPIVSFKINLVRFLSGRKIQKYYLPELKFNSRLNKEFFKKNQHSIFWAKKKHLVQLLNNAGFKIEVCYKEEELTKFKGRALYFICKKISEFML